MLSLHTVLSSTNTARQLSLLTLSDRTDHVSAQHNEPIAMSSNHNTSLSGVELVFSELLSLNKPHEDQDNLAHQTCARNEQVIPEVRRTISRNYLLPVLNITNA